MSEEATAAGAVFIGSDQTMKITWPKDIEQDKKFFDGITLANELLQAELGESQGSVTAEWSSVNEPPSQSLQLRLTDRFTNKALADRFSHDEFGDRNKLATRIHRMWGKLLQLRSGGIVKSLQSIILRSGG